jgi:hypothetical protein
VDLREMNEQRNPYNMVLKPLENFMNMEGAIEMIHRDISYVPVMYPYLFYGHPFLFNHPNNTDGRYKLWH